MNEKIEKWINDAQRYVEREEYDFSMCESMQTHLERGIKILKEIMDKERNEK